MCLIKGLMESPTFYEDMHFKDLVDMADSIVRVMSSSNFPAQEKLWTIEVFDKVVNLTIK